MQSGTVSDVFCLHFVFNAEPLNAHAPARQLLLTMHMQSNHNVRGRRSTPEGLASCFAAVACLLLPLFIFMCWPVFDSGSQFRSTGASTDRQSGLEASDVGGAQGGSHNNNRARCCPPSIATSSGPCFNPAGRLHLSSPPYRSTPVPQ